MVCVPLILFLKYHYFTTDSINTHSVYLFKVRRVTLLLWLHVFSCSTYHYTIYTLVPHISISMPPTFVIAEYLTHTDIVYVCSMIKYCMLPGKKVHLIFIYAARPYIARGIDPLVQTTYIVGKIMAIMTFRIID